MIRTLGHSQDASGFVRRECPFCHRQFKTRAHPVDALAFQEKLAQDVHHENIDEARCERAEMTCLYCGGSADTHQFMTPGQRAYIEKVGRVLRQQVRYEQLSHVLRTLSVNPNPTFVPVTPPPFPAIIPEPTDMRVVPFVCCGEEAKSAPAWEQPVYCPRCGSVQDFGTRRRSQVPFMVVSE